MITKLRNAWERYWTRKAVDYIRFKITGWAQFGGPSVFDPAYQMKGFIEFGTRSGQLYHIPICQPLRRMDYNPNDTRSE